ncbi:hypothetical protein G6725_01040 [Polynucleobacter paneuropaeus]|nr:hypothetical protein [Polynucleobacter paneuropaeus]
MNIQKFKSDIRRFFSWHPSNLSSQLLLPQSIGGGRKNINCLHQSLICIQVVPDKFFFLLFKLIREEMGLHRDIKVDLIAVRAISGATGVGVKSAIKRSSVLTWWWLKQWDRAWGSCKNDIAYRSAALFEPVSDFMDWHRSKLIWDFFRSNRENNLKLSIDGIEVGDLVVDSYLRFRPSPKFNPDDAFVRYILWQAIRDIRRAKKYFSEVKPSVYLSSYSSYIEHGISARVALCSGVPVYTFGDLARFGKRLTVADPFHTIDYSLFRADFEALDFQDRRLEESRLQLEVRLNGGVDAGTSYMKQSAYGDGLSKFEGSVDGAVIIFLHDFYDSYNAYPNLIFIDFWDWICFTIETLERSGIKFYLKPHPNQIDISDEVMVDLRDKYPDAKWLPAGVNNAQLVKDGMLCGVTAYGTVSHELAFLGVPTIGYGWHPHHSFEFCRTAKSRDEYRLMLETPDFLPINKNEMRRQALAFYYMRNLYGSEEDIELRKAYIELWRSCNVLQHDDEVILQALKHLRAQPAFKRFVCGIIS